MIGQLGQTLHAEVTTIGPVYTVQPLECLQQVLHGQIGVNGQEGWTACSSMADLQEAPSAYKWTCQNPPSLFADPISEDAKGIAGLTGWKRTSGTPKRSGPT